MNLLFLLNIVLKGETLINEPRKPSIKMIKVVSLSSDALDQFVVECHLVASTMISIDMFLDLGKRPL